MPDAIVERRSTRTSPRVRLLLGAVSLTVIVFTLLTLRHVPTPFSDLQLYASIARARQLYGVGVPTETWNSPTAVDHILFYGPVFFDLCAMALGVLGVTLLSFRLVSVLGLAIFISSTAVLAFEVSDSRDRWLWVLALLMLAPESGLGAATGAMHLLAIGFQMLALALFVRGLRRHAPRSVVYGAAAGGVLSLAALTTPRSFPFIAAFFAACVMLPLLGHPLRRETRRQCAAAVVTLAVPFLIWIMISHGTPVRWLRYMAYIAAHEDNVAIAPASIRDLSFSWTALVTPIAALCGALLAARGLRRERRAWSDATPAAAFALLTVSVATVVTLVVLNYPFSNGEYVALPLFAVVLTMPMRAFSVSDGAMRVIVALLMTGDAGLFAVKAARTAAIWNASSPDPINAFVGAHVPPGSVVVGPEAPYFFAVERNGSRYRTFLARGWADWARWVPSVEPESVWHAARIPEPPPVARFFIWPTDDELPDGYQCVRDRVASFVPPPNYLQMLGPLGHPTDHGYPATTLYQLRSGCPTGYDPTIGH